MAFLFPLRKIVARWLQPNGLIWRDVPRRAPALEASACLVPCAALECGHRLAHVSPTTQRKRCWQCPGKGR